MLFGEKGIRKLFKIINIESEDILISDLQSTLDLMMTMKYEKNCSRIILDKRPYVESSSDLVAILPVKFCKSL